MGVGLSINEGKSYLLPTEQALKQALDRCIEKDPSAIEEVRDVLHGLHQTVSKQVWEHVVENVALSHPARHEIFKDPLTHRAFNKPRGYAGDAVMIDYLYGLIDGSDLDDESARYGLKVTMRSPSARAVRNRLRMIADRLSQKIETRTLPEILSVACGHCRELGLCDDLTPDAVKRFVAMDQDKESLELVLRDYPNKGVEPFEGSVSSLLKNRGPEGKFDFIYSLGLYDYLGQPFARKLTANLFNRLHPNGELVIANFVPNIRDVGYMESFMAWNLVYRDRAAMMELLEFIPDEQIKCTQIFAEPECNILFMVVSRN